MKSIRRHDSEKDKPRYTRMHRIRYEQNIPQQFANNLVPINTCEQKDKFLRRKITPEFHLNIPTSELETALLDASGNITFTLFREATRILNIVCKRFKSIDNFIEESFGPRITIEEATRKITEYIKESNLPTNLDVIWCEDLVGSALMCSTGVDRNGNIPRHRKFTMLLKTNEENTYLRERGILNLMDHEIGTHYHRSYNEGLQPWYGKRDIYGLNPTNTVEAIKTEEGLACVHTILKARYRYLGIPALLYYGSCMAEYLPFKDLFEHLGKYITNEEQRWKHCMRIKRCLPSQDLCGGYGKDQRYFEGAVTILRQQNNIDFSLLISGKLALSELDRVRRCILTTAVRYPTFMQDKEKYMNALRQIAKLNGIPIAKCTQDRARPRSLAFPADPKRSSESQLNGVGINRSKTPQKSGSIRSTRTTSGSETSDRSKKRTAGIRSKSCTDDTRISNKVEIGEKDWETDEKNMEIQRSDSSIYSEKSAKTENKELLIDSKISMQKHILSSIMSLRLPTGDLSNEIGCIPKLTSEILNRQKTGKEYYEGEFVTLQNSIPMLPRGVCGCQLFTHGSLKPQSSETKHSGKRAKSSASNDIPKRMAGATVPVILELDLRHPLIDA